MTCCSARRKGENMSEYKGNNHCHECDANHGKHYPGCTYEGSEGSGGRVGFGGSDLGRFCFVFIFVFGIFVAALCPPIGVWIIVIGAKITGV